MTILMLFDVFPKPFRVPFQNLKPLIERGLEVRVGPMNDLGLGLARSTKADAVVLDCTLPSCGDWSYVKALRAMPAFRHTPVIVLANCASGDDLTSARLAGASSYHPKPADWNRFVVLLKSQIALVKR